MNKDEALIQRLREEATHELNHETIALILEAAEALAQPAPVQTRAVHITWNSDGVRTVNGVPDYTPPAQPAQRKPLTNGEIYTAYVEAANQTLRPQDERIAFAFARAIEAAHGIEENT